MNKQALKQLSELKTLIDSLDDMIKAGDIDGAIVVKFINSIGGSVTTLSIDLLSEVFKLNKAEAKDGLEKITSILKS